MSKKALREGKYKVENWPTYNKALIKRGDLTIWFSEEVLKNGMKKNQKIKKEEGKENMGRSNKIDVCDKAGI